MKLKIDVDEEWPVFTAHETIIDGDFVVEVDEQFYKEYLWFCYRYHSIQEKLKDMYDKELRRLTGKSIYRFPKGTPIDEHTELNRIRAVDATEAKV
jgi:hypothetical protein